ncbi:transporter [Burkholderia contaminans]|uniref:SphA family protein n=1 Tax=Burkholderia contaminans TaxID=488447 RepID=UPI00241800DA|nr:transporter [Burkholderia contaminans]WFN15428.1 transporter [Burkholderia contaminans]
MEILRRPQGVRRCRIRTTAVAIGALAATLACNTARALENDGPITPFGVFDFGAGIMPPATPNGTLATRFAYYSTRTIRNGGHADFSLTVASWSVAYIRMTNMKLFGANVGFGAVVPFLNLNGHVNVPTPAGTLAMAADPTNIGDADFQPLILAWTLPNLFVNVAMQVQAPTGAYRATRLFNPGVNHWTFSPIVGATYITDSGFEISTSIEIDQNTTNHATNYRSGTGVRQEFALGQHVGAFTAGLGGYIERQLGNDHGPNVDGNRARVNALGPAISYVEPGKPAFWLHAYKEFGAQNHAQGYQIALRAALSF